MKRIRKIVALGKRSQNNVENTPIDLGKIATPAHNGKLIYEYTETKSIQVPSSVLTANRIIVHNSSDPRTKSFHILRTKVLQQLSKNKWNTIGITAPTQGAGKSFIAANLAISLAMEGNHSVLLVDMDLSKPSIQKYFGINPEYAIHDYLAGNVDLNQVLIHPGIDRLVLLPGSKSIHNSSEQLSTPLIKSLVNELKNRYERRLIVFDLPPALGSDDVMVFLPYVDCSLMVVEAGVNSPKEIEKAIEVIGDQPLLGTILNKSEHASTGGGYS